MSGGILFDIFWEYDDDILKIDVLGVISSADSHMFFSNLWK